MKAAIRDQALLLALRIWCLSVDVRIWFATPSQWFKRGASK